MYLSLEDWIQHEKGLKVIQLYLHKPKKEKKTIKHLTEQFGLF